MNNPIVILHLSDLHFGVQSRFAGRNFDELGARLGQAVRDEGKRRGLGEQPDLVVVTGDVAQTAKREEYDDARLFFESLNETLKGVPRSRGLPGLSWKRRRQPTTEASTLHPYTQRLRFTFPSLVFPGRWAKEPNKRSALPGAPRLVVEA